MRTQPIDPLNPISDIFYQIADSHGVHHMTFQDYRGEHTPEAIEEYFTENRL